MQRRLSQAKRESPFSEALLTMPLGRRTGTLWHQYYLGQQNIDTGKFFDSSLLQQSKLCNSPVEEKAPQPPPCQLPGQQEPSSLSFIVD
jgi:hypothetical protein